MLGVQPEILKGRGVTGDGQPAQLQTEKIDQQHAQPKNGHRQTSVREHRHQGINPGPPPHSGDQPQPDAQPGAQHQGHRRQVP